MPLLSSIFTPNELFSSTFSDAPVVQQDNWGVAIMIVLLVLISAVVAASRGKVPQLLKALVVPRHFSLILREGKIMEQRAYRFLLLFDLMTFALGVTTMVELYKPELIQQYTYPLCYGIAFGGLLLLYAIKSLLQNLYVYLFDHQKEKYNLHLHKFIFISVAALTMYLFLALVIYTKFLPVINVYIVLFLIFTLIYFYNSYKINPKVFNLFHFFIYFCTLEILPWLLLVNFIVKY
ncbi:MAG: DUF4271 domain-containing protein [Bacteroidales bacterium]|nr:DUF4271 domain-containing protein [Bacteroidales bacterium]